MFKHRSPYIRQLSVDKQKRQPFSQALQWSALIKHPRFVSEWEEDVIVINIAHKNDKSSKLRSYNLAEISLSTLGGDSIHTNTVPLQRFPHLIQTLKAAINETLHLKTSTVGDAVTNTLNHSLRFFVWMIKRGMYRLSQLTHQDTEDFARDCADQGWWGLSGYDDALKSALAEAKLNRAFAQTLIGNSNSGRVSVNAEAVSSAIGLPLSANFIPSYFVAELANILELKKPLGVRKPRIQTTTSTTYAECMIEINKLALIPGGIDSIPFYPFESPNACATARFPNDKGRTRNIGLDDAVKMFEHAVNTVYDLGPAVVELAEVARTALEHALQNGLTESGAVSRALTNALPNIKASYQVSLSGVNTLNSRELGDLISKVQVGAFCLIAPSHGRRRSEIIGHDVPHGLYFGCVSPVDEAGQYHKIDIYVAKSLQCYTQFWCNKLVRDAVKLLEDLAQQFRPLYTGRKTYRPVQSEQRGDKLFISRPFTESGFRNPPYVLDFGRKAAEFFGEIKLSPEYVNEKTHPFRRIFAMLYKHRYDNPVLLAMHQHLCHETLLSTHTYLRDPDNRADEETAAALFRKGDGEIRAHQEIMEEVDSEYFEEKILKLLKGEATGGMFPRIVLQLMKKLSKNVTFERAPLSEKAKIVRERLESSGYKASEKEHCVCFAGSASKTRGRSNCYSKEKIHPELATPATCNGCVHTLTNSNYHQSIFKTRDLLLAEAKNFSLPKALRLAKQKEANFLDLYVEKDLMVAEQNKAAVETLVASWERMVVNGE